MDGDSLREQLARFSLDRLPVARAESGVTRIVELGEGWALGELQEEPVLLTPAGGMRGIELAPPLFDAWRRRVERWLTDHDRRGMPAELLPHPALLGACRAALWRWTTTTREVWVQHPCGHGGWYRQLAGDEARIARYRKSRCPDCDDLHSSVWDD